VAVQAGDYRQNAGLQLTVNNPAMGRRFAAPARLRSYAMPVLPNCLVIALACAGVIATVSPAVAEETASSEVATTAVDLSYSNRWRLEVSEGANNDGVMHFRVTPKDGAPIDINVPLKDGRGEDGCARDIRDAFKTALDSKIFKIEIDDGEDVLVKKRKGPDFAIELVESTVKGTRVNLNRE
jgi:hypothetical protein